MPKAFQRKLSGAEIKIERAKQHLDDLEVLITAYRQNSDRFVINDNAESGEREFSFSEVETIDVRIPLRAGEILQNLRSALDYCVGALVVNNHGVETNHTGFPISRDADEYKTNSVRKVQGMRQEAMDAIAKLKPYKCNGTAELWMLRCLNDRDKHRLLLTTAVGFNATRLTPVLNPMWPATLTGPLGGMFTGRTVNLNVTPSGWIFPLKHGAVFFTQPLTVNDNPQFAFNIAFNEPEIVQGEPILPTVQQLVNLVEGIVKTLSAFIV